MATKLSAYFKACHLLHSQQGVYQHDKSPEDILMVAVDVVQLS